MTRPDVAAFDVVPSRSITISGLGVAFDNAYGQPDLLPPVLDVGHALVQRYSVCRHEVGATRAGNQAVR
ncbi:hypothetical protein N7462_008326 [Penicillium macrosclerotiorum]|uniref:uncharacterized protein n=1 Tax=Penicillium macrosclerotiorum TaxID=303699 RepID=UPI002548E846|nr:uncharacterized protein N7462_008326 [Penicillium macrosclerotiorum]KAJ5675429.1 hypothetical protein N7462_008326 [Penicillium macrosclerotiorum]